MYSEDPLGKAKDALPGATHRELMTSITGDLGKVSCYGCGMRA